MMNSKHIKRKKGGRGVWGGDQDLESQKNKTGILTKAAIAVMKH